MCFVRCGMPSVCACSRVTVSPVGFRLLYHIKYFHFVILVFKFFWFLIRSKFFPIFPNCIWASYHSFTLTHSFANSLLRLLILIFICARAFRAIPGIAVHDAGAGNFVISNFWRIASIVASSFLFRSFFSLSSNKDSCSKLSSVRFVNATQSVEAVPLPGFCKGFGFLYISSVVSVAFGSVVWWGFVL